MEQVYTHDWASAFRANAEKFFLPLAHLPLAYLEIGVYEGRSMCWMLDNVLKHFGSLAIGVDCKVQSNGWGNLAPYGGRVTIYEGDSKVIVPRLNTQFDIVYIDGDHSAKGCLFDTVAAWRICKEGGIVLWDDYVSRDKSNRVAKAVQAFLSCLRKREYHILEDGEQFAVQKRS
jgi:predicted O-methyltransferase YrrM